MKTVKSILVVAIVMLTAFNAKAQNKQDKIHYAINLANQEYKDVIRFNMKFTTAETTAFWPIMNDYLTSKEELLAEGVNLFSGDYNKFTDEGAENFMKEMYKHESRLKRLKTKYFNWVRKVLPAKKFLRFLQIDHVVETAREFEIASQMPLVRK